MQRAGGTVNRFTADRVYRLTGISAPGLTAAYTYNGNGLRVARTVSGVTERDTWATVFGMAQVLADGQYEYVWAGKLVTQYPLGGGASSGRVVAVDRQGSERLVLSTSGAALGTREYDAYGNLRAGSGVSVPFDYTGNRRDAESGLLYLRARLYDPATGRFLSRDPAGDCPLAPLSAHAYLYGLANPARYTDPLGLSAWDGPAPSTMPGDYPGAKPYKGGPAPKVYAQDALDDGMCSANEPGLCIQTIMDLGLGAKYIFNYDQFVWTHNSPWRWILKRVWCATCFYSCEAALAADLAIGAASACAAAFGGCVIGFAVLGVWLSVDARHLGGDFCGRACGLRGCK